MESLRGEESLLNRMFGKDVCREKGNPQDGNKGERILGGATNRKRGIFCELEQEGNILRRKKDETGNQEGRSAWATREPLKVPGRKTGDHIEAGRIVG